MKFAVIGAGSMANRRIRHVQQLRAGEVVVYDVRADRRAEVERNHGVRTVDSLGSLIAENPDAIFVSVPPAYHRTYVDLAVERGWHFITEQPIFHTDDGLDELVEAVERRGLITHVSCNMRFHQSVRRMKQLIEEDAIGPVATGMVEIGEWLPDWHPYEPYTDYYPSRRAMGGGLDAICDMEWLGHLFGPMARMACFAGKKTSLDIDTEDVVQMLLEYESGPQLFLHADMIQRAYTHKAKFVGEKGVIEWDWARQTVRLYRASTQQWETFEDKVDVSDWPTMKAKPGWEWVEPMYLEDARAFINRVKAGDSSTDSLREGIYNLRLVLRALESNNLNRVWLSNEASNRGDKSAWYEQAATR